MCEIANRYAKKITSRKNPSAKFKIIGSSVKLWKNFATKVGIAINKPQAKAIAKMIVPISSLSVNCSSSSPAACAENYKDFMPRISDSNKLTAPRRSGNFKIG